MEIARLRAELARVKMKRDTLGKGESAGRASSEWPARRTRTSPKVGALLRQVRYTFIERHRQVWPITVQCQVLNVSVSDYHGHVARQASTAALRRYLSDEALLVHIA